MSMGTAALIILIVCIFVGLLTSAVDFFMDSEDWWDKPRDE